MGETTAIEWADATWNPWRGCDKVSPGCAHCYMFTAQARYGRDPGTVVRAADSTFYAPMDAKKWRELPPRSKVFTCSWSDWFHEDADEWREDAWDVVSSRPDLDFLILTKRPERIREHLPASWGSGWPNVWLGVSVENRRFVGRVDALRDVSAVVRFISAEPLIGPLFDSSDGVPWPVPGLPIDHPAPVIRWPDGYEGPELDLRGIDWLIAGGESGPGHRRCDPEWVRDLRDACLAAQASHVERAGQRAPAFFLKQWGGARPGGPAELDGCEWREFPVPRLDPNRGGLSGARDYVSRDVETAARLARDAELPPEPDDLLPWR